jgi:hypothetical protein
MKAKCPNCSKIFDVDKRKLGKKDVCPFCDTTFEVNETTQLKSKSKKIAIPVIIALVILCILIGVLLVKVIGGSQLKQIFSSQTLFSKKLKHHEEILLDETPKIGARSYAVWSFYLEEGESLVGTVRLNEYDINVFLLKEREFEAYKLNETFHFYQGASRERTQYFSFNFEVPETQTYYFLLSNRYSILTPKYVRVYLQKTGYK